jgi:hypothetical protein
MYAQIRIESELQQSAASAIRSHLVSAGAWCTQLVHANFINPPCNPQECSVRRVHLLCHGIGACSCACGSGDLVARNTQSYFLHTSWEHFTRKFKRRFIVSKPQLKAHKSQPKVRDGDDDPYPRIYRSESTPPSQATTNGAPPLCRSKS